MLMSFECRLSVAPTLYTQTFSVSSIVLKAPLYASGFIVIVWQPLEHISAPSPEPVGARERVFADNMSGVTNITLR